MYTEDFTSFSLDMNFARCLSYMPSSSGVYKPLVAHNTVMIINFYAPEL